MSFSIVIDHRALKDIQQAIDYYDEQQSGLGKRFEMVLHKNLRLLQKNPFLQIRYDNIRCLPITRFPYMVHFTVDESRKIIAIRAVFHTSRSTKNWEKRK